MRLYISIDAWHDTAFDRLAAAMLAELPAPLYTLVRRRRRGHDLALAAGRLHPSPK
ncbi:hypothetical protein [Streptomyces rubradiris]|uniref:hypothetical protein n=1 Tax=Streptomyces rubradiris TaxID=285531 RepID=UPI0027E5687C|nr:hypothetical protein [Streptomyces rubradiris]